MENLANNVLSFSPIAYSFITAHGANLFQICAAALSIIAIFGTAFMGMTMEISYAEDGEDWSIKK